MTDPLADLLGSGDGCSVAAELRTILERLRAIRTAQDAGNEDRQTAHELADGLLMDAIEALTTDTDMAALGEHIVDAFGDVRKWYA